MDRVYRIGAVGMGRMGMRHVRALAASDRWDLAYVCDLDEARLAAAHEASPSSQPTREFQQLIDDPTLDAVSINTLSNIRPSLIRQAVAAGKHVACEKPLAPTAAEAGQLLNDLRGSDRLITTNLINRNASYVREAKQFIDEGQIGELAVIRIDHCTSGLAWAERQHYSHHAVEGQVLHDCGMHYVDVMRWFAGSEYRAFNARGLHFWKRPFESYFMVQGEFENNILFDLHNSHAYSTLAEVGRNNSRQEYLGSHGVITLSHDFRNVTIQMNGRSRTVTKTIPYSGKNLDTHYTEFAVALDTGDLGALPRIEDAVIASQVSQRMVDQAMAHSFVNFGEHEEPAPALAAADC